ncbi:hypothetical protein MN187_08920 [Vagococcus sp. CY52-2]|nr:hypothetical protein [Vagococcus sp. CY53-2]UNM89391.1 hypothetical protein MN187_08920 [Vagococcus sp. CY52-2]
MLAVAVLGRQVMQPQFEESRIIKPDVQALLQKALVKPDADFTKRYPKDFCARITNYTNEWYCYNL